MFWVGLIVGIVVGANLGLIISAIFLSSKQTTQQNKTDDIG